MSEFKHRDYLEAAEACIRDGEADIALRYFIETGLVKANELRIDRNSVVVRNLLIDQADRRPNRRPARPLIMIAAAAGALAIGIGTLCTHESSTTERYPTPPPARVIGSDGQTADSGDIGVNHPSYTDVQSSGENWSGNAVNTNYVNARISISNTNTESVLTP